MTRVGAIDCGTNSIRLLIADIDDEGRLTDVVRRTEVVRLGYGVDRTGVIDPVAMERTLVQTREYAAQCREHSVERVRFVATSASRDASNASEFVTGVENAFAAAGFDVSPEVVSGDAEANLSFTGATGDLVAADVPGPYLVIDLGGGSTEFVRGTASVESARSVDIGCVRISERHLTSDPASDEQIAAATADITAAIDRAEEVVDLSGIATVVGLAGSITTITAHALGLTAYAPDLHPSRAPHAGSAPGVSAESPPRDDGGARRTRLHAPGSRRRHRSRSARVARDPRSGARAFAAGPGRDVRARHPRRDRAQLRGLISTGGTDSGV